ncbi:MAG TPA: hypothetical protein VHA52_06235 [Candidatus Babeliaceae bacterium]|jgi:hypothetical protein|nr:hypothetical protein [Candidatus Babeliaceae bacterium]
MVITIKKGTTQAQIKKQLAKLSSDRQNRSMVSSKKKSLKEYYGALKRGINGLTYQKEMRYED